MFTTLAKVRIADAQRFIDVFSTHGLAKRPTAAGVRRRSCCLTNPASRWWLIDWADRASFDAFRADPEVPPTMRSGSTLEPPQFTVLERRGLFEA